MLWLCLLRSDGVWGRPKEWGRSDEWYVCPGQWPWPKMRRLHKQICLSSIVLTPVIIFCPISHPVTEEQNEEGRYLGKRIIWPLTSVRNIKADSGAVCDAVFQLFYIQRLFKMILVSYTYMMNTWTHINRVWNVTCWNVSHSGGACWSWEGQHRCVKTKTCDLCVPESQHYITVKPSSSRGSRELWRSSSRRWERFKYQPADGDKGSGLEKVCRTSKYT